MDPRYTRKAMTNTWDYNSKYSQWVNSCVAVTYALSQEGKIDPDVYLILRENSTFDVERVEELDNIFQHDAQALIETVKENLRALNVPEEIVAEFGNRITSYDMEDPGFIRQICNSLDKIIEALQECIPVFRHRALEFKNTVCLMYTHNQGAGPGLFGLRICNWIDMLERDLERVKNVRREIEVGKFGGAIGIYEELSPEIEAIACEYLNMKPVRIATQIIHRDRHAHVMSVLAILASNIEHISWTLWMMCGFPRCEARTFFDPDKYRGSTAMPYKVNPWRLERLWGMASLVRGYLNAILENIATPDERAINQSCVERVAWPDGTILVHYMITEIANVFGKMHFFPKNMKQNLDRLNGVWAGQHVKNLLREKGIDCLPLKKKGKTIAVSAYDWVKACTFRSWSFKANRSVKHFKKVLIEKGILDYFTQEELDYCFSLERVFSNVQTVYDRFGI